DGFGCLIPRKSGPTTLGSIWASSLFPQRAPEGQVLLTNFIGGGCHPEIADWDEEKVVQTVLKDLGTILELPDPPKPTFIHPIHYSQAIPQYTLGHRERIDTLHQALTGLPGIALAGNYLNGVSLNDTVKSGDFAAGILLQDLKALQK
ncbi:MAG: FAD-dependent oxidoreductase, partial [Vampirovibrio sp.]|nr:FAD-dependent oxidoreductase [Vampirovibrio sp.]